MKPILRTLVKKAKLAKEALQTGRAFHCTVALRGSKVIAIGYNDYTQLHPYQIFGKYNEYKPIAYTHTIGLHSEIACIKQILFRNDYHKLTLVNIRIDNNGLLANAKPCVNCQRVLNMFHFKRILYSTNFNQFKEFKSYEMDCCEL
jgi:deoxycytidylate deaminase